MSDYQTDDDRYYKRNIDAPSALGIGIGVLIALGAVTGGGA